MSFDPFASSDVRPIRSLDELADLSVRRGAALRRRHRLLEAASLAVIVAVVMLVAPTAFRRQAAPERLRSFDRPSVGTQNAPAPTDPAVPASGSNAKTPTRGGQAGTPTTLTGRSPSGSADSAPSAATGARPATAYPLATGCSVDSTGLATGATRSCRFTATKAGGWWAGFPDAPKVPGPQVGGVSFSDAFASIWVTRGSTTTPYDTYGSPSGTGCANAIIQPGDLVEVDLKAGSGAPPGGRYEAGAGFGWSCRGPNG